MTTLLKGSDLRWVRNYKPNTRYIINQTLTTEAGMYTLSFVRARLYIVSFAPRQDGWDDQFGETIDLGQYETRTECDRRVLTHIATGN